MHGYRLLELLLVGRERGLRIRGSSATTGVLEIRVHVVSGVQQRIGVLFLS